MYDNTRGHSNFFIFDKSVKPPRFLSYECFGARFFASTPKDRARNI